MRPCLGCVGACRLPHIVRRMLNARHCAACCQLHGVCLRVVRLRRCCIFATVRLCSVAAAAMRLYRHVAAPCLQHQAVRHVRRLQRLPIPERRAQQLVVLEEHIERARVVARLVAHLITMKRTTTLHRRWRGGGEPNKHASKQANKLSAFYDMGMNRRRRSQQSRRHML